MPDLTHNLYNLRAIYLACAAALLPFASPALADQAGPAPVAIKDVSPHAQNASVTSEITIGNGNKADGMGTPDWDTAENSLVFPNLNGGTVRYGKLSPACSTMLDNAVNGPELPDQYGKTVIHIWFTPKSGTSLEHAAQVCGFKEFNWIQQKIAAPARWVSASTPLPIFDMRPSNPPFYYDSVLMNGQFDQDSPVKTINTLNFYDQPHHSDFRKGEFVEYKTVLVGVMPESSSVHTVIRPLFVATWKSNWTGQAEAGMSCLTSDAAVKMCSSKTINPVGHIYDVKVWSLQDTMPSAPLSFNASRHYRHEIEAQRKAQRIWSMARKVEARLA